MTGIRHQVIDARWPAGRKVDPCMEMETLRKRSDIDSVFKWKLEDMYPDEKAWEKDFRAVHRLARQMKPYQGFLAVSAATLLGMLDLYCRMYSVAEMVYCYARMRRDEDNSHAPSQVMADRASAMISEISAASAFLEPEILQIPADLLRRMMKEEKGLAVYRRFLKNLLRQKKHILDRQTEELLALSGDVTSAPHDVYTIFNNADIRFPPIRDDEDREMEVTKGRYQLLMESRSRKVRREAFESLYSSYEAMRNTLASNYNASVKVNRFYTRVRKYRSCLEGALESNRIDTSVYDNLIDTTHKNLPLLHRYLALRKKIMGLDELHPYDLYVPIIELPERKISFGEAKEQVCEGLAPLGKQYVRDMRAGMESGWLDVYETQGKTGGAYSWGAYRSHPYVLLNHQDNLNSVFTLAHEMGHAMHSLYSNRKQHFINADYPLFLAEVASTVNESILMQHMIERAEDRREKAWLLNHYLEEFRGTMFRQVMFAEFEKRTHEEVEKGGVLTADSLCALYRSLNETYFGSGLVIDRQLDMEWSRIPHFYRHFYVYQYATGFSAAEALSRMILGEGDPAVRRYLEFLSSGRKDYPLILLKKAGVDLAAPAPVQAAFDLFETILNRMEALI